MCVSFCKIFFTQVEEETVVRVDLENRLQSLKEELAFSEQLRKEVNQILLSIVNTANPRMIKKD